MVINNREKRLLLASASPRRIELLGYLRLDFSIITPDVDESSISREIGSPGKWAESLAVSKACWGLSHSSAETVIGADTMVIDDKQILGKPYNPIEGEEMLCQLRGRVHKVVTGVCVLERRGDYVLKTHVETDVIMRCYSDLEVDAYIRSGEYADKAGAYGIQSKKFAPVSEIYGCYLNVVGLPICALVGLLRKVEVKLPVWERLVQWLPEVCRQCSWHMM
ncbi:Maf family protein [Chloroflexota bacterium]